MKVCGEAIGPWMQRRVGDPTRGIIYEWTRTGTRDAIRAVEATLAAGSDYEVDETNPPMATITLRTPVAPDGDENGILQTTFELSRNLTQKSGYEHYKALAISKADLKTIRRALKENSSTSGDTLSGDALTFYNLMLNGQDSFITSNFVFRITQMISRAAIINIAYSGLGTVYTSTELKNEVNAGALYNTAIDQAYAAVLAGQYQGSIPSGFTLGWMKHAPTISSISGNRSAVSVEYWLEAWTTFYYP